MVRLAEKYNVYIVEDDIAADFDLNAKRDPLHYHDISNKVIYIKSFSKILMPGLRIAAVVLPSLLLNTFLSWKQWTDTCSPILSQGTLSIYLVSGLFKKHQFEIRDIYARRVKYLKEIVLKMNTAEIEWSIPDGGFFACMELKSSVPFEQVQPKFMANSIRMMDTRHFFLDEFKNDNYFRISISKTNAEEKIGRAHV